MTPSADNYTWERYDIVGTPLASQMRESTWRPDAPVPLEQLTLLMVDHLGFDGSPHRGEIIVHTRIASTVIDIFRALYNARFPIEKMRLLHHYGGDDDASMADNNSSAFNARPLTGQATGWSKHSYGVAIDINPVLNPYVTSTECLPAEGMKYIDRTHAVPGLIQRGDACYEAFIQHGFEWGGEWSHLNDYHHFDLPLSTIGY